MYYHCFTKISAKKFWNKVEVTKEVLENYASMDVDELNLTSDCVFVANEIKGRARNAIDYLLDSENVRLGGLDLALDELNQFHELRRHGYNDEC